VAGDSFYGILGVSGAQTFIVGRKKIDSLEESDGSAPGRLSDPIALSFAPKSGRIDAELFGGFFD
jgi:hypothetical protein